MKFIESVSAATGSYRRHVLDHKLQVLCETHQRKTVADYVGVSEPAVHNWLHGSEIRPEHFNKLMAMGNWHFSDFDLPDWKRDAAGYLAVVPFARGLLGKPPREFTSGRYFSLVRIWLASNERIAVMESSADLERISSRIWSEAEADLQLFDPVAVMPPEFRSTAWLTDLQTEWWDEWVCCVHAIKWHRARARGSRPDEPDDTHDRPVGGTPAGFLAVHIPPSGDGDRMVTA
jgi:hypothetical protein